MHTPVKSDGLNFRVSKPHLRVMFIAKSGPSSTSAASSATPALAPVVRVKTLGDQAYESLREALSSGELAPGQRVTVRGLVSLLNIGFTPAREALNRLAAEACLEPGPQRGLLVPYLSEERYRELVAIRLALEPIAATAALSRIAKSDIDALKNIQKELLKAKQGHDYVTVLACNREFHFRIYRQCEMPTLMAILESLWMQTGPMLRLLYPYNTRAWKGGVNHAAILKALTQRDEKKLSEAIRQDLIDGSEQLCEQLRKRASDQITTKI